MNTISIGVDEQNVFHNVTGHSGQRRASLWNRATSDAERPLASIYCLPASVHSQLFVIWTVGWWWLIILSQRSVVLLITSCAQSLTPTVAQTLVHSFISCRLDYCNSLLYGIADSQLRRLQSVQNAAERLITGTRRTKHITPVLLQSLRSIQVHWLPVRQRMSSSTSASTGMHQPTWLMTAAGSATAGPALDRRWRWRNWYVPSTRTTFGLLIVCCQRTTRQFATHHCHSLFLRTDSKDSSTRSIAAAFAIRNGRQLTT